MEEEKSVKKVRNLTILAAAVYIVFGLIMFLWPSEMLSLVGIILGLISLVFGIVRLVLYFTKDRFAAMIAYDLVIGILFSVLGVLILIFHNSVVSYLSVVFGIFLLIGSIIKVQNAVDLKRIGMIKWWIVLIFAGISIVFAILLILKPEFINKILISITGVFLMADGLTGLITIFMYNAKFKAYKKKMNGGEIITEEAPAEEEKDEKTDSPESDAAQPADGIPAQPMNFDPDTGLPVKK